eukprot:m.224356 g.224356  ORF g.224356 m.224356 type:complete len:107 (-) comp15650_c1_seq3:1253-1573(-)
MHFLSTTRPVSPDPHRTRQHDNLIETKRTAAPFLNHFQMIIRTTITGCGAELDIEDQHQDIQLCTKTRIGQSDHVNRKMCLSTNHSVVGGHWVSFCRQSGLRQFVL